MQCFIPGDLWERRKVITRNTCTQQPLARLPNLFSVITVILLINMPIPFKFESCQILATNLNAANSLGLGQQYLSFFDIIFL